MPGDSELWPTTPAAAPQPGAAWSTTLPASPFRAASAPVGIAGLAATPVAALPAAGKSRRGWIAGIAAVVVVAVLGASAYGIYASFLRPLGQVQSAKYLPDNTLVYVSIDLAAANNNSHHIHLADLGNAAGSGTSTPAGGLGLNWQTDILPWIGPTATFAVIPGGSGGSGGAMNAVALLQSHDDGAASKAVQKYLTAQQQHGSSYSAATYSGFSLHAAGGNGTTIATGSGWVIVASTGDGARTVIDRLDGKGTNLYGAASFQQATGSLPADRFGTMYINLHALSSGAAGPTGALSTPVLGVYPTAAGSLEWTSAGMRWQTTLHAAQGGFPAQTVSGSPNDLAALVPATAQVYAGVANVGGLTQSIAQLVAPTGQATPDPLKAALGIAASDPALQQPAAVAMLTSNAAAANTTVPFARNGGVVLIHVASDADATRLLAAVVHHANLTASSTTVDGVAATQLLSNADASTAHINNALTQPPVLNGIAPSDGATQALAALTSQVVAVEAVVSNTMVIATSTDNLKAVIETAKGASASLASSSAFQKLAAAAPSGSAASAYIDLAGLQQALHIPAAAASKTKATGALLTLTWNNTELQTTFDAALDQ